MTYRVYLRWPDQKVSDKTVTEDRAIAELAFKILVARTDLIGKPVGAAFTTKVDGKPQQIAYHAFDAETATPPSKSGATISPKKPR
jgi:hypothetical protein